MRIVFDEPTLDTQQATSSLSCLKAKGNSLFARDISLPQIVVTTQQPPEVIRDLYREWRTGLFDGEWDRERAARERA